MWCKVTSAGATDYCVGYSFFLDSKNMTAWKENLSLAFCSNLMRSISISQPIHKSLTHSIKLPSMTRLNKYATHLKLHLTSEHLSEWYQRGNLSFVNLANYPAPIPILFLYASSFLSSCIFISSWVGPYSRWKEYAVIQWRDTRLRIFTCFKYF